MSRITLVLPLACLPFAACTAQEPLATDDLAFDGAGDVIEGEFVIHDQLTAREMETLGLVELRWNDTLGAGLYYAEDGVTVSALDRALQQTRGEAGGVEHNRPVTRFAAPNDTYYRYQWDMKQFNVETAWTYSTGAGIKVAVIDSGVSSSLDDRPKNLLQGYDFVADDRYADDENGHGTHVAGTIAQNTNNSKGCVGVAPDASILPIRVLDADGFGDAYATAEGIVWAVDNGAKVINMSLGSSYSTTVERNAVDYANSKGVVVVAASGNEGRSSVSYPAAYNGVIAVGASRYDGSVTAYSNGGTAMDLVAPGGDIGVDQDRDGYADGILQQTLGGYEFFEGTSMASPHVAGVAALLLADGARADQVLGLMTSTAKDVGSAGWDSRAGYGLVQPVPALQKLAGQTTTQPPNTTPPADEDVTPPSITNVRASRTSTSMTITWTTNEPASSYIRFEGYGTYGDDSLVTSHSLRFTVSSSGTYKFTVISDDADGNTSESGVWTSTR